MIQLVKSPPPRDWGLLKAAGWSLFVGLLACVVVSASCGAVDQPKWHDPVEVIPPAAAKALANYWYNEDTVNHRWSQPDTSKRSMGDAIRDGDITLLERYRGAGKIGRYKIVSYDQGILHRVMDETEDAVYLSGDGNRYSEGWVAKTRVHWTTYRILRPTSLVRLTPPLNRG